VCTAHKDIAESRSPRPHIAFLLCHLYSCTVPYIHARECVHGVERAPDLLNGDVFDTPFFGLSGEHEYAVRCLNGRSVTCEWCPRLSRHAAFSPAIFPDLWVPLRHALWKANPDRPSTACKSTRFQRARGAIQ